MVPLRILATSVADRNVLRSGPSAGSDSVISFVVASSPSYNNISRALIVSPAADAILTGR